MLSLDRFRNGLAKMARLERKKMADFTQRLINGTRNPTQPADRGMNMLEWATVIIAAAMIANPGMGPSVSLAEEAEETAQAVLDETVS